uniref:Uncharacterized protein n=1 Tax=Caenorhabditis japonica TaxID=281687 RepID=A0A8R1IH64_CAEJA
MSYTLLMKKKYNKTKGMYDISYLTFQNLSNLLVAHLFETTQTELIALEYLEKIRCYFEEREAKFQAAILEHFPIFYYWY